MKDILDRLTPSQKKILRDQEAWMKDFGETYSEERTRIDAIDDIIKRFPTERDAYEALEVGGDPSTMYWYSLDKASRRRLKERIKEMKSRKKKSSKPALKCKCK